MNTKEFTEILVQDAFGPRFQQELEQNCRLDGAVTALERSYEAAKSLLVESLSPDHQMVLSKYEALAKQVQEAQGSYGFLGGLYCGFRQLFTVDCAADGGFDQMVAREIFTQPRMNRHQQLIRHTGEMASLMKALSPTEEEPFLSISCVWEQRAYSAAVHGFGLGYEIALELADYLSPGDREKALHKLETMEDHLGLAS